MSPTNSSSTLFEPLKLGKLNLSHRVAMAPLTRFRSDDNHVPLSFVKEYYTQRASVPGTLLITEGTYISARAGGMKSVPGIWSKEQAAAWKEITDSVHSKGSYIYCQLWALGRAANAKALKEETGLDVFSSSAIPMSPDATTPKEMTEEEIVSFIGDYREAARIAVEEAGFDGVEIHGANGYLPDQFTQDVSNKRTDAWGGSVEKRARFGLEVAKAVVDAVGADRVGYRISPYSRFQGMRMQNPVPQFSYLAKGLKELDLAYLHAVESRISGNADVESHDKVDFVIDIMGDTPVLVAGGYQSASALQVVEQDYKGKNVVVVFGRLFIANPDLPFRIKSGIELQPYDRDTFYKARSVDGYTDYPFSKEFEASKL